MLQVNSGSTKRTDRTDSRWAERRAILRDIAELYMTTVVGVRGRFLQSITMPPPEFINAELERLGEAWRVARTAGAGYVFQDF